MQDLTIRLVARKRVKYRVLTLFSANFHRCRLFGRLALTDRSVGQGRNRQSVRFHLRDNTVDIDGRFGYTYGELWSISTVGSVHSTQKLVDIDHIGRFIKKKSVDGRYRPSNWTYTQKNSKKVLISSLRTHTSQCQQMKTTVCHTRF